MSNANAPIQDNEYEIRDRWGKLLFTATPELYQEIVTQTLMNGRYVHTFEIFKEPKLEVSFRTIAEGERTDMMREIGRIAKDDPDISEDEADIGMALQKRMRQPRPGLLSRLKKPFAP